MDGFWKPNFVNLHFFTLYSIIFLHLTKKHLSSLHKNGCKLHKNRPLSIVIKRTGKIMKVKISRLKYFYYQQNLAYLCLLLLLCGDVQPNPGPLKHHHRHPDRESLVVGSWNVRTLLERKRTLATNCSCL